MTTEAYRKLERKTKETLAKLQSLIERDEAGRCLPWSEETEAVYARWEKLYREYRDARDFRIEAARAAESLLATSYGHTI